jgi:hypothetical protein
MTTRKDVEGTLARWFAVDADSHVWAFSPAHTPPGPRPCSTTIRPSKRPAISLSAFHPLPPKPSSAHRGVHHAGLLPSRHLRLRVGFTRMTQIPVTPVRCLFARRITATATSGTGCTPHLISSRCPSRLLFEHPLRQRCADRSSGARSIRGGQRLIPPRSTGTCGAFDAASLDVEADGSLA